MTIMKYPLHLLCYHCEADCADVNWCYGCKEVICTECDQTEASGRHRPEDHLTGTGKRVLGLLALLRLIEVFASSPEKWTNGEQ